MDKFQKVMNEKMAGTKIEDPAIDNPMQGVKPQRRAIIKMSRNETPTKEEMDAYNRTCKG